jgi:hypothetical protein
MKMHDTGHMRGLIAFQAYVNLPIQNKISRYLLCRFIGTNFRNGYHFFYRMLLKIKGDENVGRLEPNGNRGGGYRA